MVIGRVKNQSLANAIKSMYEDVTWSTSTSYQENSPPTIPTPLAQKGKKDSKEDKYYARIYYWKL